MGRYDLVDGVRAELQRCRAMCCREDRGRKPLGLVHHRSIPTAAAVRHPSLWRGARRSPWSSVTGLRLLRQPAEALDHGQGQSRTQNEGGCLEDRSHHGARLGLTDLRGSNHTYRNITKQQTNAKGGGSILATKDSLLSLPDHDPLQGWPRPLAEQAPSLDGVGRVLRRVLPGTLTALPYLLYCEQQSLLSGGAGRANLHPRT